MGSPGRRGWSGLHPRTSVDARSGLVERMMRKNQAWLPSLKEAVELKTCSNVVADITLRMGRSGQPRPNENILQASCRDELTLGSKVDFPRPQEEFRCDGAATASPEEDAGGPLCP